MELQRNLSASFGILESSQRKILLIEESLAIESTFVYIRVAFEITHRYITIQANTMPAASMDGTRMRLCRMAPGIGMVI
jgi:hypothetical protein